MAPLTKCLSRFRHPKRKPSLSSVFLLFTAILVFTLYRTLPSIPKPKLSTSAKSTPLTSTIALSVPSPHPHPHQITRSAINTLLRTPDALRLHANPPTSARFILYRALGNDLPPRHAPNQTLQNLQFILDHEPRLPSLERRWYINRIVYPENELSILQLLISRNETFTRDALDFSQYANVDFNLPLTRGFHHFVFWDLPISQKAGALSSLYNDKNIFVIHNNNARNAMLSLGKATGATYILPFDGNCFFNKHAWHTMVSSINKTEAAVYAGASNKTNKYFAVGMARMISNEPLKDPEYSPPTAYEEPQIVFHRSSKEIFNEKLRYGLRPKVELLWRLRISGGWDSWSPSTSSYNPTYSDDVPGPNAAPRIDWVARLFSGVLKLEKRGAANDRGRSRAEGLERLLNEASQIAVREVFGFGNLTLMWYDEKAMEKNRKLYKEGSDESLQGLVDHLVKLADAELTNSAVYSVTHKRKVPPSGDKHDYLSVAPYYWPNASKPDGIPFVKKDGRRTPESELYSDESDLYDQTRLASFSRNVTILALAGYFTGSRAYYEKAASQIRIWFLDDETRMNPNLKYAQMRFQSRHGEGDDTGITDFVNIVIVLDVIRLLGKNGALSNAEMSELTTWARKYGDFLHESKQGHKMYMSRDHHGTLFDAQAAAVAGFTGDFSELLWHTSVSRTRMREQFFENGSLKNEISGKAQLHYMMYGLQSWVWLARMSERIGVDIWEFQGNQNESYVRRGMKFCVPYFSRSQWTHGQASEEDMSRMLFLYYHGKQRFQNLEEFIRPKELGKHVVAPPKSLFDAKPIFDEHHLIPPFWNLAIALS